jgi:methoxymalonate biosynthesis acyl carrier protein
MDESEVGQAIMAFLRERFGVEPASPDANLIEDGILDSMMFVDLVMFIEERFGVVAALEDLEIDNFGTVAGMARFVADRGARERPATIHRL